MLSGVLEEATVLQDCKAWQVEEALACYLSDKMTSVIVPSDWKMDFKESYCI